MSRPLPVHHDQADLFDRPFTPRSVIASTLLGMRTPRLPGSAIVRWAELFGVGSGSTRVALSRMVKAGDLTASDGTYELAGHLRKRQAVQDWSLRPKPLRWEGDWIQAVVPDGRRSAADRTALRNAMGKLRMAELREGVWMRPDNLPDEAASAEAIAIARQQCDWFTCRPEGDAAALASQLFPLTDWADRVTLILARMKQTIPALEDGDLDQLSPAFILAAAGIAHVRADPILPADLLPKNWPGKKLRTACERYDKTFQRAWRRWHAAS